MPSDSSGGRKRRSDAEHTLLTDRDQFTLAWIGQQYGIRLDHLQWLLGCQPGRGAAHNNWISEGAARDVVTRWKEAGWVHAQRLRVKERFWAWLTPKGLRKMGMTYLYRNLAASSLDDLTHLAAINEVRLQMENPQARAQWIGERQLLQGIVRVKGKELPHRPDAEIAYPDGLTAIEVELSVKKPFELSENLMELLRGEEYLRCKCEYGWQTARSMSRFDWSQYSEIWYFAPPTVRKHVRRARAQLVQQGVISAEEAKRLYVYWYPLAETDEESLQEEQEEDEALDHGLEGSDVNGEESMNKEEHPLAEGEHVER
jgi:hypothetical protein